MFASYTLLEFRMHTHHSYNSYIPTSCSSLYFIITFGYTEMEYFENVRPLPTCPVSLCHVLHIAVEKKIQFEFFRNEIL